jgi:hypothetical protein
MHYYISIIIYSTYTYDNQYGILISFAYSSERVLICQEGTLDLE